MNHEQINAARREFMEAHEGFTDAMAALEDKRLDQKIAEREGKHEIAANFKAEVDRFSTDVWYKVYTARKERAEALCRALNIDPKALKDAL